MSRLAGKVAIITGGASGTGRGAVELFLHEGAQVVAADIQDDKGALLVDELGPSVSYFRADVGEEREVEALVADTVKRHGRLDCLFNNAGLAGVSGPMTIIECAADRLGADRCKAADLRRPAGCVSLIFTCPSAIWRCLA
jgi:NAD(P)-dependent dehydrogenase (short-subunit alcohol dehydrogenase family)